MVYLPYGNWGTEEDLRVHRLCCEAGESDHGPHIGRGEVRDRRGSRKNKTFVSFSLYRKNKQL